jgi:hypothetical protein
MGFCRASIDKRPPLQLLAEFSVIVLGMLLFCERTWKHHCVTLLLPFSVLAYCVSAPLFSRGFRWYLGITLTFVALLMLSTSTGIYDQHTDVQDRFGKLAQVYGAYVWAFLLLLASTFVISWANPESGSKLDGHQSEPEAQARAGLATNETLRSLALRAQNLPRE